MQAERRREPRYPFIAMAEIVDEKENARTSSRVSDLSHHRCYVGLNNPFPQGTYVTVEIYTETEFLETPATVTFLEAKQGHGPDVSGNAGIFHQGVESLARRGQIQTQLTADVSGLLGLGGLRY